MDNLIRVALLCEESIAEQRLAYVLYICTYTRSYASTTLLTVETDEKITHINLGENVYARYFNHIRLDTDINGGIRI